MMSRFPLRAALAVFAVTVFAVASAQAQQSGGSQPGFTFGGTGIPHSWVLTNTNSGTLGIILGLSASGRCSGAVCGATVTNDGANTFFAAPGAPFTSPSHPTYASWNFDFGVLGANAGNDRYVLLYGIDPADGGGTPGSWNLGTDLMDSENLGFGFLTTGVLGIVTPPSGWSAFNPNAVTQYDFALEAFNKITNNLDASVFECVSTAQTSPGCASGVSTVPEPGTMSLLATGLVGLSGMAGLRRKRRR